MEPDTSRLEIRLPRERRVELDAFARQWGLSSSALVKLALARFIAEGRLQIVTNLKHPEAA
jgi:hypothetical protein